MHTGRDQERAERSSPEAFRKRTARTKAVSGREAVTASHGSPSPGTARQGAAWARRGDRSARGNSCGQRAPARAHGHVGEDGGERRTSDGPQAMRARTAANRSNRSSLSISAAVSARWFARAAASARLAG